MKNISPETPLHTTTIFGTFISWKSPYETSSPRLRVSVSPSPHSPLHIPLSASLLATSTQL
ncbi:hypothetical protein [Calothrix sp. UHCC 0171]|uniref:hypothetical protein n=1 Tax=Calothrix sp. UHCC 0171 TaxID=3110245 RepID=UPI002B1F3A72|nr:hypothetical protein [Calothrix sp. UHCC 0171]MEA5569993.1 hypothetical protein [Calothrix sp. UHCC 0171]